MKVLHICENLDDRYGGPAKSVPGLANHLEKLGIENILLSAKVYGDESNQAISTSQLDWRSYDTIFPDRLRFMPDFKEALEHEITSNTVIHVHTLWSYPAFIGYKIAKKHKIPLVVSTRGMLYSWALEKSWVVKRIALAVFQKKMLENASAVHITEPGELNVRFNKLLAQTTCVIPNGIDLEEFSNKPESNRAKEHFDLDVNKKHILFASRIHPKKGLIHLVSSWIALAAEHDLWDLIICGSYEGVDGDFEYYEAIRAMINSAGLESRVKWTGFVAGEDRLYAFAAGDLFVLPSYSENFGNCILEALSAGLPVITTTGTPWKSIVDAGAGWQINLTQNELDITLKQALSLGSTEFLSKGIKAKSLASDFSWTRQARKMADLYIKALRQNGSNKK